MTLGEKIRLTRSQRKLSQQDLADKVDIHQKNISKYEADSVVPSALTLKAIADVLEVSCDYLLGEDAASTVKDTALIKLIKDIDNLPQGEKDAVLTVINGFIKYAKTKKAYAR